MVDKNPMKIRQQFDTAVNDRLTFDTLFQEVTDHVLPHRADFNKTTSPGLKRTQFLFDSTAPTAAEQLASSMIGSTTASASRWFELGLGNNKKVDINAARWLQDLSDKIYSVLNSPSSNFGPNNHECLVDWISYGTGVLFIDENIKEGIRFKSYPLSDVFIEEDFMGRVNTIFRRVKRTARQAYEQWGEELSPKTIRLAKSAPDTKIEFMHYVCKDYDDDAKFPFYSVYMDLETSKPVEEGGYNDMPYLTPRWSKLSGEKYGRGPAIAALSDIKMLNAIAETTIRGMRRAINPVLLTADDDTLRPLRLHSTDMQLIVGGLDHQGTQLVRPLESNPQVTLSLQMLQMYRESVREAFFVNKILVADGPAMTATEVLQRQEERLRLMAPQFERLQTEYFEPLITRVVGILIRSGEVETPPDSLLDRGAVTFAIQYVGALARSQRSSQVTTLNRLVESVGPLAQLDPSILDRINPDSVIKKHADLLGFSADLLRSDEEMAAIQQQRAQAQQQAQMAQAMQDSAPGVAQELVKQGK